MSRKKSIIIAGSGGFARETLLVIERINNQTEEWDFLGYVDSNGQGENVIGTDNYLNEIAQEIFVAVAIGNPALREKIVRVYSNNHYIHFPNIIDPSVIIGDRITLGEGNIICAGSIFTVDIEIGSFNIINLNTTIGHDTRVGDYVTINPGTNISGNVNIKNRIEIGTGVKMIPGVTIENDVTIGAGAVVVRSIMEQSTVAGVPARMLKKTNE